jgi:putative acetyltransferase
MIEGSEQVMEVRREQIADAAAVRAILEDAFGGSTEADLVDRLRASHDLVVALVAERVDGIAGYVAFPRLLIEAPHFPVDGAQAVVLAPLAVAADLRRRGIGGALVRGGLAMLAEYGEQLVLVVGDPAYYSRFGFSRAAAASFRSPYSGSHFMALALTPTAPASGIVRYPSVFDQCG